MKRHELLRQARVWNRERRARSRPLKRGESERLARVRARLLATFPNGLLQSELVRTALGELDMGQFYVKLDPGESEPGVLCLLSAELFAKDDDTISVILMKVASTLAVYGMVAKLLKLPPFAVDYFAEGYTKHGCLLGRATLLTAWMTRRVNTHIFLEASGIGAHLKIAVTAGKIPLPSKLEFFLPIAFQMADLAEHRASIYGQAVQTEPRRNFRVSRRTYSEESVWDLVFGAIGVRYYRLEVPKSPDRRSQPSARRLRATGTAYLQ